MKRLTNFLKQIRVKQILGLCFAAVLLFVTTACSPSNAATPADSSYRSKDTTENYVDLNERPGRSSAEVQSKTNQLKRRAEDRMIDMTGDVGDNTRRTLERKGENADRFGRQVKESAEATREQTAETTKGLQRASERGSENIKENAKRATEATKEQAAKTGERTTRAAKDAAETAQEAVK